MTLSPAEALALLDWKRRIFGLYAGIRTSDDPGSAWRQWVDTRRHLFQRHAQSPIQGDVKQKFEPQYFPYSVDHRVLAEVVEQPPESYEIDTSGTDTMRFTRIGRVDFPLGGENASLDLYWLDAYGGGLFLPFRDATSGGSTYGAGRYLLDTVKGADLGSTNGKLVLDFNFAYNPSCAYDPRWVCPLAPPPNRLDIAIEAGEKTPGL